MGWVSSWNRRRRDFARRRRRPRAPAGLALLLLLAACAGRGEAPRVAAGPAGPAGGAPALAPADSFRSEEIAPGVRHAFAWDARGPWAIHVLEVDLSRCDVALEARKAGPPLAARARTSELSAAALAAVNADFFRLPAGTPVGPHVRAGEILIGPGDRPAFAWSEDGVWIGRARVAAFVLGQGTLPAPAQVNRAIDESDTTTVALFTHWFGDSVAAAPGTLTLRVRHLRGMTTRGGGDVVAYDTLGTAHPLDGATVVLRGRGGAARLLARVGPSPEWRLGLEAVFQDALDARPAALEAVGGFPELLRDGEVSPDLERGMRLESFGPRRHPRTALGVDASGRRLWLVTVDGRQEPYSAGMTLPELVELMRKLGADDALNLDGGGSTAMVVRERVVNRPSDREGERSVGNALVVVERRCPRRG